MTLAYLTDENGATVLLEDVPAEVREALAAKGVDLVEGYLPAGDGKHVARVVFSIDKAAEAERITAAAERLLNAPDRITGTGTIDGPLPPWAHAMLYGDGHRVNRGLLAPAYQEPTESDSRQRRRWLARKGKRRT